MRPFIFCILGLRIARSNQTCVFTLMLSYRAGERPFQLQGYYFVIKLRVCVSLVSAALKVYWLLDDVPR